MSGADADLLIARESLDILFPDDGTEATSGRASIRDEELISPAERPDMTVESFWLGQAASTVAPQHPKVHRVTCARIVESSREPQ